MIEKIIFEYFRNKDRLKVKVHPFEISIYALNYMAHNLILT